MRTYARIGGLVLALTAGCDETPGDAAREDAAAPFERAPIAPAAPRAVTLAPCPEGWRTVDIGEGTEVCHPWEADELPTCDEGAVPIPGSGCVTIGSACPEDGWPSDLPASGVVYARAGAPEGDGSRDAPYGTLAEALADARSRTGIVALAVGEYAGGLEVRAKEIRGACASGTIVSDDSFEPGAATLHAASLAPLHISNLRVVGGLDALDLYARTRVVVEDVWLEGEEAVHVGTSARFEATSSALVGASEVSEDPQGPNVIEVYAGAQVTLRRAWLQGGRYAAIGVFRTAATDVPGRLEMEDVAVVGSLRSAILGRAEVHGRGVVVEGSPNAFFLVDASSGELEHVVVRGGEDRPAATAIALEGNVRITKALIERAPRGAVRTLVGAGSEFVARVEDVVVRDLVGVSEAFASVAQTLEVRGARVERVTGTALLAYQPGAVLDVSDVWLRDVRVAPDRGDGAVAFSGGRLHVARMSGRSIGRVAVGAFGPDSFVHVEDVDIEGSRGLHAQCADSEPCATGAEPALRAERVRLRDAPLAGIFARSSRVEVSDVEIDGVLPLGEIDAGYGVLAERGARLDGTRIVLRRATHQGIASLDAPTRVTLAGVEVWDTAPSACAEGDAMCEARAGGNAFACAGPAELSVSEFVAARSALAGTFIVEGCAVARFERGSIRENVIGMLQDVSLATNPIVIDVTLEGNQRDTGVDTLTLERPQIGL